ncbi:CBS domain-containing protein [Candidatus Nitrospira bockiana]
MAWLTGAGLGAGLMYLFDPDGGRRRRALLRDQAAKSRRMVRDSAQATARDAANRARGLMYSFRGFLAGESVPDSVLAERVRAKLGMLVRHPRAITVEVDRGRVALSGPVLADELDHLLKIVARVPGVVRVDNQLDVHEQADGVPELQGGPVEPRRGERFELMQRHWSPTARLLAGTGGAALAAYGLGRRSPAWIGLSALGVALLVRSVSNEEWRGLIGLGAEWNDEKARRTGRPRRLDREERERPGRRLKDIMTAEVEVIHPDASIEAAAEKMKALDVGVIPVCDGERLVGIVTDRDLVVRAIAEHRDPKHVTVREVMSDEVIYGREDDLVEEAALLMVEKRIRRLPVLDREQRLVGIVSLGDLAVHTTDTQLSGEVLEYVSQPAMPRRRNKEEVSK